MDEYPRGRVPARGHTALCRQTVSQGRAACLIEWGLDRPMQNYLRGQYRRVTHDTTLPRRPPFYTIAYLAHRPGCATPAAHMLGPHSPDAYHFQTLAARYSPLLQQKLSQP